MIDKLINYGKIMVIPFGVILLSPIILSILNLIGVKTYDIMILIIMVITSLITGFFVGRKSDQKGYINGIIFGLLLTLIMFILSLFFKDKYGLETIIYYLIIISSCTVGSMIGIQKSEEKTS